MPDELLTDPDRRLPRPAASQTPARALALTVTLAVLWLLLSGHFEPLLLFWGMLSVLAVIVLCLRMRIVDEEGFPLEIALGLIGYLPWLTKEMAKSSWDVTKIILNPSLPISPAMRSFQVIPRTDLGKVIYGNSITLTPGTITTGIVGDVFEIHALTAAAWDGTEEGEMGRRVHRLEGGK